MKNDSVFTLPPKLHKKGSSLLASGIVKQAVKEWVDAQKMLKKYPEDEKSYEVAREIESFFRSSWYTVLQQLAPEVAPPDMISKLKEMEI